jgi:adenine/guanine phosphoribosyltransferase-like PRPP-binding protein
MAHTPNYCHVGYLRNLLPTDALRKTIEAAVRVLELRDFDAIAFQGMSGALIAPALALKLDKNLLMVRKQGNNTHSTYSVEGDAAAERYVIVDDLVDTGSTVMRIIQKVAEFAPQAECIGFLTANYGVSFNTTVQMRGRYRTMQEIRQRNGKMFADPEGW